ncbi:MAG: modification methylase SinI [Desulfosporosinus sp. BRH_c37]|nr:MAG: modification methylase SinI [Desulfosporosinus sp. BRH_c37]
MPETKSLSIHEAAEIMGKSDQFVRVGLQRGILPFGSAVKLSTRWTYYISPTRFYEYVGEKSKSA